MAIALVAHPALGALAEQLGDALPITGLYYPARSHPRDATLPFFSDLSAMLAETGASSCVFLSPYQGLHKDIGICLEIGIDVLCAGPVPQLDNQIVLQTSNQLVIGGIHHSSPLFNKALVQRNNPSFAAAVYLRFISGAQGPGLLPAWWAACSQWAFAVDLLGESPTSLHLSAYHQGRAYQVSLTAVTPSGTAIQLVIAPQRALSELTLLGQGGLISASSAQGGIALASALGTQVMHDVLDPPEIAWVQRYKEKKDRPQFDRSSPASYGPILLRGLRQALRLRQPVSLSL